MRHGNSTSEIVGRIQKERGHCQSLPSATQKLAMCSTGIGLPEIGLNSMTPHSPQTGGHRFYGQVLAVPADDGDDGLGMVY